LQGSFGSENMELEGKRSITTQVTHLPTWQSKFPLYYETPMEWEEIQNHFEVVYEEWVDATQAME
jgi:hypothetical protein